MDPLKSTATKGTKYSISLSTLPVAMRLPMSAATALQGMSIDFNQMVSEFILANKFARTMMVPFQYRYTIVDFQLSGNAYEVLNDRFAPYERGSTSIAKACGLIVCKVLGTPVLPLSGRLPSAADSDAIKVLQRNQ